MRRQVSWLVAVLAVAMVAGCGGVSTPSGVTVVRPVLADPGLNEPDIRKVAPGPVPGATPEQLVRGFLAAESNDDDDHAVAREFLAPNVNWNPSAGVTIYDPTSLEVRTGRGGRTVQVGGDITGAVDPEGSYGPAAGELGDSFTLTRVGKEWRITSLPNGLRLTDADVDRVYRRVTVWFLAPGRTDLVAEPLLLPVPRQALPTAVVRALLRGPTQRLSNAVRTAVPPGVALLGTAAVVDGVVGVDLAAQPGGMRADAVRDFLAQLGATLAPLPSVTGIRVTMNGRPLLPGSSPVLTPAAAVAGYQTDGGGPDLSTYAVSGSRLIRVTTSLPLSDRPPEQQVPADAGIGGPLHSPAVSPDGTRIAVLRDAPGGSVVLTGPVHGTLTTRLPAGPYSSPSWGPSGELWLVRAGVRPSLLVLPVSGGPVEVALPAGLAAGRGPGQLRVVRLSRDGVRIALVFDDGTRSLLLSAVVVRGAGFALAALGDLTPSLPLITDVAWETAARLVVLGAGARQLPVRPYEVGVDGSGLTQVSTAGLPVAPDSVTAAPGLPLVVGAAGGVWALTSGWLLLRRGQDPVYAG